MSILNIFIDFFFSQMSKVIIIKQAFFNNFFSRLLILANAKIAIGDINFLLNKIVKKNTMHQDQLEKTSNWFRFYKFIS